MAAKKESSLLQAPLIKSESEVMELATGLRRTSKEEPCWLNRLYMLGFVYPVLAKYGMLKHDRKTCVFSMLPCILSLYLLIRIIAPELLSNDNANAPTVFKVWAAVANSLLLLLQLSLSYTRKPFSDAILGDVNRLYINTVAKRGLALSFLGGLIHVVCYQFMFGSMVKSTGTAILKLTLDMFHHILLYCLLALVVIRSLFLARTSFAQVKVPLIEQMRGTEVEGLQIKLLEINKLVMKASVSYLQVPLSLFFGFGMLRLINKGIIFYKNLTVYNMVEVLRISIIIVSPLWVLTRVEKFYLLTLRDILHRNAVMPLTPQTNLLAKYDTIAPRASIFGIYITRGRVASIMVTLLGSILPKIAMYLYNNLGNLANGRGENRTAAVPYYSIM